MLNSPGYNNEDTRTIGLHFPRTAVIGLLLITALFAFELFNFDTTRYALQNLLGDVSFGRLPWATILAVAFCAIDFAGLSRLFTPEKGDEEPAAVWYLMGAWLLGATMNAMMTWWAVSLTLLAHDFGNEVMSREQLLQTVPIFVASLVWLTRILFIGAFSVAGDYLFVWDREKKADQEKAHPAMPEIRPVREKRGPVRHRTAVPQQTAVPHPLQPSPKSPQPSPRIQRRPPVPAGMHARGRRLT